MESILVLHQQVGQRFNSVQYFPPFASLQGPPAKHQRILVLLENLISKCTKMFVNPNFKSKQCNSMVFMMVSCRISSTSLIPKNVVSSFQKRSVGLVDYFPYFERIKKHAFYLQIQITRNSL